MCIRMELFTRSGDVFPCRLKAVRAWGGGRLGSFRRYYKFVTTPPLRVIMSRIRLQVNNITTFAALEIVFGKTIMKKP